MKHFRVTSWAYVVTIVLVTVVLLEAWGSWNRHVGASRERAKIVHSLLMKEFLEHNDSIVAAIALQTAYLFLYRRDSLVRARRAECGPLKEAC